MERGKVAKVASKKTLVRNGRGGEDPEMLRTFFENFSHFHSKFSDERRQDSRLGLIERREGGRGPQVISLSNERKKRRKLRGRRGNIFFLPSSLPFSAHFAKGREPGK